jgi:hypothetical protein
MVGSLDGLNLLPLLHRRLFPGGDLAGGFDPDDEVLLPQPGSKSVSAELLAFIKGPERAVVDLHHCTEGFMEGRSFREVTFAPAICVCVWKRACCRAMLYSST